MAESLSADRLDEIAGRLAAATPGPWRWAVTDGHVTGLITDSGIRPRVNVMTTAGTASQPCFADGRRIAPDGRVLDAGAMHVASYFVNGGRVVQPDAVFIAGAPRDVGDLLSEVRRLGVALDTAVQQRDAARDVAAHLEAESARRLADVADRIRWALRPLADDGVVEEIVGIVTGLLLVDGAA